VFRWHVDTSDSRSLGATGLNHGTRVRSGFDKSINTVAEHSVDFGGPCRNDGVLGFAETTCPSGSAMPNQNSQIIRLFKQENMAQTMQIEL